MSSSQSRRKLLKSIAAGGGAIAAGKSLPESWSRPVVDSVLLPVHAQTSPPADPNLRTYAGATSVIVTSIQDNSSMMAMVAGSLVPAAQAAATLEELGCATETADGFTFTAQRVAECSDFAQAVGTVSKTTGVGEAEVSKNVGCSDGSPTVGTEDATLIEYNTVQIVIDVSNFGRVIIKIGGTCPTFYTHTEVCLACGQ